MTAHPMDRRRFLQLTLGATGAVLLGACDGTTTDGPSPSSDLSEPASRPTLQLASPEVGFPSPYAYGPGTHSLVLLIYDTLLVRNADGDMDNWLASSFERSDDGTRYAFEVAKGARWHDGKAVTAQDVVFSFDYFADHADELPPTVLFRPDDVVSEVRATGKRTGEIILGKPWVAFDSQIAARFPIVPQHVWADVDAPADVTDPELLVGSGPYRLETFEPTAGAYLFVAFDDFFLGTPFVKRLEMRQVENGLVALRAGEIDAAAPETGAPVREAVPAFQDDDRFGVLAGDPDFFTALSWNAASDGPPGDVAFRRACLHAIDRQELVERLLGSDGGVPGNPGFLPPHHDFHHDDVASYPYDPARAEALLAEAGYERSGDGMRQTPDGEPLRLTLLTFPELAPVAELVRDSLGQVGIEVEFDPTDFFTAVAGGKLNEYEMALLFFGGLERDPDLLREFFSVKTAGEGIFHALGWRNDDFEALAQRQRRTLDEDARREMINRMQELIATDLPLVPLYYVTDFLMYDRSAFDQWSVDVENKLTYVTGKATGEPPIRPIAGENPADGGGDDAP